MAGDNIIAATSVAPKIIASAYLGTSAAALYTVPASTSVKVATATICNITGGTVTLTAMSLVAPGGGVNDGYRRFISSFTLLANDTLSLKDYLAGAMLGPGDVIAGYAGTASALAFVLTGTVHT